MNIKNVNIVSNLIFFSSSFKAIYQLLAGTQMHMAN